MRVLGYHKEEQEEHEESENRLCIRFPLHPTLSHLLNLVYLLVAGLIAVCSPCSRFRLLFEGDHKEDRRNTRNQRTVSASASRCIQRFPTS